jgi:hypothetical protein
MAFSVADLKRADEAGAELATMVALSKRWLQEKTGGWTGETLLNDAEKAAVKATRDELVRAETWKTTWRAWAEKGWHPDGYAYKLSHYLQVGADIAKALSFYTKQGHNASAFNLIEDAAEKKLEAVGKTAEQALKKLEDTASTLAKPWPWWVKGVLGLLGLAATGAVVRKVVK